jgi:RNA polymerase sigma-70 factor (ECF subfamily)|tara:strand:- start:1020 stop:1625 length:606 start_codon:yes stop_codon:yes gene_type:complete
MASYKQLTNNFLETKSDQDFAALYNKIKPGLTSYVYKIVKDSDMAEDIAINTLTKMWTKIEQYNPKYGITTWLYRIAFNDALGYINTRNKTTSLNKLSEYGVEVNGNGAMSTTLRDLMNESEEMSFQDYIDEDDALEEKYRKTLGAINDLKEMYRDILVDRMINHMKYDQLATKYNLPLQTIKNRIRRGKALVVEAVEVEN